MANARPSHILIINAGSSSVKFVLYEKDTLSPLVRGVIDRVGMDGTFVSIHNNVEGNTTRNEVTGEPAEVLVQTLTQLGFLESLTGVGHRIVHGGGKYHEPIVITDEVLDTFQTFASYAPRHLPVEILLVQKLMELLPRVPHIACFDTAFHHQMPKNAQIIPVPALYRNNGVRRYGFHGLSYEYLLQALQQEFDVPVKEKRIVLAHLGSGASLTAVHHGLSVDTTMGFTPNSGIPMSTRTGDVDAGLFEYFTEKIGMTGDAFNHMVNYESGLLAVSGTTSDMEVLLKDALTSTSAEEAISYFTYHVRKQIGALTAVMGGIDILVFTGGIGERSSEIRTRITEQLHFLGIELDENKNKGNEKIISRETSSVSVYTIPANEELIIAQHVQSTLNGLS